MKIGNYEYQSTFARAYVAQGLEEGLQKGKLIALFEVLDARGLKVDAEARQRILALADSTQLRVWLRRAVTVDTVQELFEQGPAIKPVARKASKQSRSTKARRPRSKR